METLQRIFQIAVIGALLTSCAGNTAGLWGDPATPTAVFQPSQTPTITPVPSFTPTASITPLKVIPMPGSPTPGQAATQPPPTSTTGPSPTPLTPTATLPPVNTAGPMDVYQSQGGDSLHIVARRFALKPEQIIAAVVLPPPDQLIPPNTLLLIPKPAPGEVRGPAQRTIPDSEIVYGPSSIGFNTAEYVKQAGGFLSTYEGSLSSDQISGIDAVERIAQENSLSPRILLAIIEYESHWVLGRPTNLAEDAYPLGYVEFFHQGLFRQLMWASGALSDGYYRWRSGDLDVITFKDGTHLRLSPFINAGTAAIQYYFAQNHTRAEWEQAVAPSGFPALYERMFGPAWPRASAYEPTIPAGLAQPPLSLPFEIGKVWALTGGPHSAWEEQGALAAIDLAPGSIESGCVTNDAWVLAPAAGKVVRTAPGVVMLDLDGDGYEQTGWVILFLHIRSDGKAVTGQVLQKDDHIGHASCEGGRANGTHLHIARKYNGEWILADGPLPFDMDGWIAHNGTAPYKGSLTRDDQTIVACTCSSIETNIIREKK
ncbi:MAG TPA: hypothetical protein VGK00_14670 [Anaerolineales bacterium]|jgi:murein DD-endopeptidase MepM/ murein hydrolase activator NlpD